MAGVAGCAVDGERGPRDDEQSRQLAVLAAELAAFGTGEPPPDEELWDLAPEMGGDSPGRSGADVPAGVLIAEPAAGPGSGGGVPGGAVAG
jgi:hypothetical protein